jgi:hypothetical protein
LGIEEKIFMSREASKVAIHIMTRHSAKKEETTHHSPWLDESEKLSDGHHVDSVSDLGQANRDVLNCSEGL